MARFKIGLLVSALALATGGCVAQGRVSGGMVASSDLVLVELHPGVWVIEDYNEPVFYADNYFWLYRDDGWYRSSTHTGGWVRYRSVPQVIVRLDRPHAYVHYRAAPGVRVRRGPRGPISVRDRRDDAPPARRHDERPDFRPVEPTHRPPPPGDWQDKREEKQERREEKAEEKAERREEKAEEKAERREDKAERREDKAEAKEERREDKADKAEHKHDKPAHKPGKGGKK